MFQTTPIKEGAIVFLGDSITEGGSWNEMFKDSDILNRGIGGDTTRGVLNRLDEVIRHQPSKLFLMIGTNDIGFGIDTETIAKNYKSILQTIIQDSPKTEIFVQSVLPVTLSATSFLPHNNAGVLKLNEGIKKICQKLRLRYIDLHPHFSDANGNLYSELTNDGLHLLGSGYLLWKELIELFVKS
jgi:lysophospholipase L1-like esterase